ncbi:MAG: peptidoglycan-binding protein [Planctomycetota bacterium]|jgi:hypothetical protein|nr:peptidoglycan-binding protein [Planctomycetota bacterium]
MKVLRLMAGLACGAICLTLFSGCETQQSACEREKRITGRLDELQMDLDGQITSINAEMANLRANPPVVVQQAPISTPVAVESIAIEDGNGYRSKSDELQALANASRWDQLYAPPSPPARAPANRGNIRVPVPARTVQAALREAGFYNGNIDGKVGPQTVNAITGFQRNQGIKADGIVGRTTWQHLQAFVPAGMTTVRAK